MTDELGKIMTAPIEAEDDSEGVAEERTRRRLPQQLDERAFGPGLMSAGIEARSFELEPLKLHLSRHQIAVLMDLTAEDRSAVDIWPEQIAGSDVIVVEVHSDKDTTRHIVGGSSGRLDL